MILDVTLSNKALESLMIYAKEIGEENFINLGMVAANNYINKTDDPLRYCLITFEVDEKFPRLCRSKLRRDTERAMRGAYK